MISEPRFHLTRHAALCLRDIHAHSVKRWGKKTADKYMAEIYAVMTKAAATPEIGQIRAGRAVPFLMVPAGQHFIVYDEFERGIIILTLLHQRRDIERVIATLEPAFLTEILLLHKSQTHN